MAVIAEQLEEFTCASCFMVRYHSELTYPMRGTGCGTDCEGWTLQPTDGNNGSGPGTSRAGPHTVFLTVPFLDDETIDTSIYRTAERSLRALLT